MGLRDRWEAEFLRNERVVVLAVSVCLIALSELTTWGPDRLNDYLDENRFSVFPQIAALSGTLLGLVIAASALVLDRVAEGRLALVGESRHETKMWGTFRSAMAWLGVSTLLALAVLVPTGSAAVDRGVSYLWLISALLVVARLTRTVWIVGRLMDIVKSQSGDHADD